MRQLVTYVGLTVLLLTSNAVSGADLPRIFMTSVTGTGNLSTWADAHGLTGINAADEICRSRASAGGLSHADRYVAFISDSNNDAYCHVHGLSGRVYVNQCNSAQVPTGAGPWYRMDGLPAMDVAQNSLVFPPSAGYVPRPIVFDEFGNTLLSDPVEASLAYTGTMGNGVLRNLAEDCGDWTDTVDKDNYVSLKSAYEGYPGIDTWGWICDQQLRLICLEKGSHGAALPRPKPHTGRVAFVTSASGPGNLQEWADSGGATGLAAADNICRAAALRGNLPMPDTFKAWLATSSTSASERISYDGPWYRTDSALVAHSLAEMTSGLLEAPIQMDESGNPVGADDVWTGAHDDGTWAGYSCTDWTDGTNTSFGNFGQTYAANAFWGYFQLGDALECSPASDFNLYCFGDNDSIYVDGFDQP